jgi:ABC-2 type transport system ATP-binding protein
VDAALAQVGLSDRAADLAGRLSKGLKQRVAIARALIHQPPVVLLDEPTSGLDPASARHMRDLIRDLRREGRALLVSTHNLAEAEELSDRIAVLNTSLLALDSPAALRRRLSGTRVVVEVEGDASRWMTILMQSAATGPGVRSRLTIDPPASTR